MLFLIAWRNLWRNRTRSLVILLSVAVGLWAGAFIVAFYYGVGKGRLRIAIDREISHIQVHHHSFGDDMEARFNFSEDSMLTALKNLPQVKAYSLRSVTSGMLANASGSRGVKIVGVDGAAEDATRSLQSFVKEGTYLEAGTAHRILVGKRLSEKLKIPVGGKVVLTFLDTANDLTSGAFRVCGLYTSENSVQDEQNVFVLKTELDELLGTSQRAHEAAVLLQNDDDLEASLGQLKTSLPSLKVETWKEVSPETALILGSLDTTNIIYIGIILLALSFGIVNTMLMAVLERTREIGVLMALGMSKLRLFGMVMFETILLTVIGAPLGILVAWATVAWLGKTGINMESIGGEAYRSFGFSTITYPELTGDSVLQIMQLVLIAAVVAAIYPAWKAIRQRPVEAMRG